MAATLSNDTYYNILNYLRRYTKEYEEDLLECTDNEIYSKYKAVKYGMEKFPFEIDAFYKNHPEVKPRYSLEQLLRFKYEELHDLRIVLGLSKRQKVKSEETAEQITMDAIFAIKSQTAKDTIVNAITTAYEPDSDRDLQILTPEEIRMMYGDEELSAEELATRGFFKDEISEPKEDEETIRFNLIDEIYESNITINGTRIEIEDLLNLTAEELSFLLSFAKKHIAKNTNTERLIKD